VPSVISSSLTRELTQAVLDRVDALTLATQREALPEQARLALSHGKRGIWHLLVTSDDGSVVAYAQAHSGLDGLELQIMGDHWVPEFDDLLASERLSAGRISLWLHGQATPIIAPPGYSIDRVLRLMRVELPSLDPGSTPYLLRTFIVGRDEDSWLEINARAFADHPDQGGWTRGDLDARLGSSWFDPRLFLVLMDGQEMIGFCWVKMEPEHPDRGEIYVIAVDPGFAGQGLGRYLVLSGLTAMHSRGASRATLYVEDDNQAAISLYEGLGFIELSRDIRISRQA
jgi:mycothiol synthase